MTFSKFIAAAILGALGLYAGTACAQSNIDTFIKQDLLSHITISPNGDYLAMTVPQGDKTGLVVMRRSDLKVTAAVTVGEKSHVLDNFRWVSPTRLVFAFAEKFGSLDQPQATGELLAMDAEGGKTEMLVGYRVAGAGTGSRISAKKEELVYASLVDDLPDDDKFVIIAVSPFSVEPQTRAERMDVHTGRRTVVARVPVKRASFVTDPTGVVRFALGASADNMTKLYYRSSAEAEWQLINDEAVTDRIEAPLGFSEDGKTAYLDVQNKTGPDSIVGFDPVTLARTELLRDPATDPWRIISAFDAIAAPIGAVYMGGTPHSMFFDKTSRDARLQRSLEASFPGHVVFVTSATRDGKLALIWVSGASTPGEYFLFDTEAKTAAHVFSQREGLDPKTLGQVRTVEIKSRDGLSLHGFLTLPPGSSGKNLPLVVIPHGGPFGIEDEWTFNGENQILAGAGYAVLQVNFRGSAGYGRAFMHAGARQWGGTMQDDLTDATHWAVSEGIANGRRICIYGASYGGYAALMGAAKEPGLYRCAVGYVGVYDLAQVVSELRGDGKSSRTWGKEWIGEGEMLASGSPVNLAAQIKIPVLLAAGGEDRTAPISHSRKMEAALRKAGVPVETLYFPTEGHGFYLEADRRQFYQALLGFLGRNLNGTAN